jgi:hypothetical protein
VKAATDKTNTRDFDWAIGIGGGRLKDGEVTRMQLR